MLDTLTRDVTLSIVTAFAPTEVERRTFTSVEEMELLLHLEGAPRLDDLAGGEIFATICPYADYLGLRLLIVAGSVDALETKYDDAMSRVRELES